MNEHSEQSTTTEIDSWRQWSVWLARTGHSSLERSTVMALQQINRSKIEKAQPMPARVYAAALEIERAWDVVELVEVAQPLMLAEIAD